MDAKSFKNLMDSIDTGKKAVAQLDNQMGNLKTIFGETIDGLDGEDKQKVQTLQAMVNRTIAKAQKGQDYNEALDKIKETFKNDIKK